LIHDVVIALGVFALFRVEINLPVIAAFLTIVGYSVNDTIVIYDRIRENLAGHRRSDPYELINRSLNQSLRRTIHTSLTTFLPVFVLTLFGGSVLFAFALALLMGVLVGTYSSIYVASSLVYLWGKKAST
jgi:preprotein translocase subunit SecF